MDIFSLRGIRMVTAILASLAIHGCATPAAWEPPPFLSADNVPVQARTPDGDKGNDAVVDASLARDASDTSQARENKQSGALAKEASVELIQDNRLPRDRAADIEMEQLLTQFFQKRITVPDQEVHVDVWEGRVMLIGNLDNSSPGLHKEIRRFLRAHPHIRVMYDHMRMPSSAEAVSSQDSPVRKPASWKQKSPPSRGLSPTVRGPIYTKPADLTGIEERLAMTQGIRPVNYRWRTQGNTVYLLGRAVSQSERDRVADLFQKMPGVAKMVDYIQIKGE
ncbi:MAG: BON domain-containing protein [Magnetococcales bacterium]|nr:BON domain-containing protein [Magnetococcales bacterium]